MSLKILLADDSVTAQNMGKKILSDAGFEVVAVSNGSAALKKIPDLKPDLIILDIYMPGYTGLEVCQKIKEARQTSAIPVLLTVGKLEPFKARDASRVRADGFIVKPFEATELLAMIKRIVGLLPEQTRKPKNGDESKSRVKQAKQASQEAEAEQLASALRNVLPSETRPEEHFESGPVSSFENTGEQEDAVQADHEFAAAGESRPEPHPVSEPAPFPVNAGAENTEEEDQAYKQCEVQAERESAKFRVDFEKPPKQEESHDEGTRFTASTFETWEQSRRRHYDAESRETALARIRAARETEATEQQESPTAEESSQEVAAVAHDTTQAREDQAEHAPQFEAVGASSEQPAAEAQQPEEPSRGVSEDIARESPGAQASEEQISNPPTPISGLADWAADLREEAPRSPQSTSYASRWIAEEVALDAGESGVLLSQEIQCSPTAGSGPTLPPVQDEVQPEAPVTEFVKDRKADELAAREPQLVENPEPAFAATEEASTQPENAEAVAALAKAAAAAAMTSIGEIREAVLASAAAAGAGVGGRDSMLVVPQIQPPVADESSSAPLSVDASQFAAESSSPGPADDVQGATIAAVTREVHEAEPADLNSDAIASIVNRVIEQMKPKLVAEIAKELTHKPKNE